MKLRTLSLFLLVVTASLSQSLYATVEDNVVSEDSTACTPSTNDSESVKSEPDSASSEQSLQATQETADTSAEETASKPVEQLFACSGEESSAETASADKDEGQKEETV